MPGIDVHGNNEQKPEANCRSCTDFKSWAKMQRNKIGATSSTNEVGLQSYIEKFIHRKKIHLMLFHILFHRIQ